MPNKCPDRASTYDRGIKHINVFFWNLFVLRNHSGKIVIAELWNRSAREEIIRNFHNLRSLIYLMAHNSNPEAMAQRICIMSWRMKILDIYIMTEVHMNGDILHIAHIFIIIESAAKMPNKSKGSLLQVLTQ